MRNSIWAIFLVFVVGISFVNIDVSCYAQEQEKKVTTEEKTQKKEEEKVKEIETKEPGTTEIVYTPTGKDPFESALPANTGEAGRDNLEGLLRWKIDELSLEGIVEYGGGKYRALLKCPQNKPYSAVVGDKVYNGEILRITPYSVVFKEVLPITQDGKKERLITKEINPERGGRKK